jgi:hypothetical protein
LTLISSKNGKIEELKREAANEKYKSQRRLFIIIGLAGVTLACFGFTLYRFIKCER